MDSRITKNHIILKVVERLKIPYKEKEKPYLLIIISGELVLYKNSIINLKIELIQVNIKKQNIIINFDILPLE